MPLCWIILAAKQLMDFAKSLRPGDRLISTDLASAKHHVGILPAHWKYLGFELDGVQYVNCVLLFGLSASAGAFCRFSTFAAKMIRQNGLAFSQPSSSTSTTLVVASTP
jgi:hypothetical protein